MITAPNPTFTLALTFVTEVDQHLAQGTRHFRDNTGCLLHTLDQVIDACLNDRLAVVPPLPHRAGWLMEADYLRWMDE